MEEDPITPSRWQFAGFWRPVVMILGVIIMLISPLVGAIPGPGGVFVFALGLAMVLRSSRQSRKLHAKLRRKWPRYAHLTDLGLGRWKKHNARKAAKRATIEQDSN